MASFCAFPSRPCVCARARAKERENSVLNAPRDLAGRFPRKVAPRKITPRQLSRPSPLSALVLSKSFVTSREISSPFLERTRRDASQKRARSNREKVARGYFPRVKLYIQFAFKYPPTGMRVFSNEARSRGSLLVLGRASRNTRMSRDASNRNRFEIAISISGKGLTNSSSRPRSRLDL